jgi:hypothetical protein
VSDWIRQLIRASGASTQWHVARDKGFTTTAFCGAKFEGPIEIASSDDRTEKDGRCSTCELKLAEKRTAVAGARAQ